MSTQPRILLLGRHGQLGWELNRVLAGFGILFAVDYPDVDFSCTDSVRRLVDDVRPDIVINAAAYTAVDKAESEPELARAINATAPSVLAEAANAIGASVVHYSTDYVFNGAKDTPYTESDSPEPLNVYGQTKLAGDRAVQASGAAYLIFRLSWVYSWRAKNFVKTILRLGAVRTELSVVNDQIGSPTAARCIAQATGRVLSFAWEHAGRRPREMASALRDLSGIYNLTCAGSVSWYEFARAILESDVARALNPKNAAVIPISQLEYCSPASRPANSRLSNQKIYDTFGVRLPHWEDALLLTLEDIAEASALRSSAGRRVSSAV